MVTVEEIKINFLLEEFGIDKASINKIIPFSAKSNIKEYLIQTDNGFILVNEKDGHLVVDNFGAHLIEWIKHNKKLISDAEAILAKYQKPLK